jgi:hypothetical protein
MKPRGKTRGFFYFRSFPQFSYSETLWNAAIEAMEGGLIVVSDSETKKWGGWSRGLRVAASLGVIIQLMAVIAEPFRFFTYGATRGSSPAAEPIRSVLAPYVEFAFLNHGYFFFAPEPGPSHLMQATLAFPDGSRSQIRYPDKQAQRPRLLYHRHFMLSEFLNQLHAPPVDPLLAKQMPRADVDTWVTNRRRFELVRGSMESHLAQRYGADQVHIDRMRHILPGSDAVLKEKLPLDHASLYMVLPDSLDPDELPLRAPALGAERQMLPTHETFQPPQEFIEDPSR